MKITEDIVLSFQRWGIWFRLGLSDTVSKYRRSYLGPLWITLGIGVTICGIGTFWSIIWGVELKTFFPYFSAGLLVWNFIVGCLVEGSFCFISQASVIRATPNPLFLYPLRLAVKLFITFAHNLIIFFIVLIIFKVPITFSSILIFPGFVLLFIFAVSTSLLFGIIGTRYRDFPPIVESLVPLLFFVTPVIWFKNTLGSREILVNLNPLSHLIDIMRKPMLGEMPSLLNYSIVLFMNIFILLLSIKIFSKTRNRISLWI